MTMKLFLLGLPGSGKSTVVHHIETYVRDQNLSAIHFSDYAILRKMFEEDTGHKQFALAEHGGFNVIDLTAFDTALKVLEQSVDEHMPTAGPREMILIEFARNDYHWAFRQFSDTFVQDAYLLYLDAEIDICKQRILDRIADPATEDDYFVSDYIFEVYYRDNKPILWHDLIAEFEFDQQKVKVINNNGSLQDVIPQISDFVDTIYKSG